jgi:hypothetical protein
VIRRWLLTLALCLVVSPAWGAISVVANVAAGSVGGADVTTGAIDTTGANLLIACVGDFNGAATPTDSKSNTWNPLTVRINVNSGDAVKLFYAYGSINVGSGHTFTGVSTLAPSIAVLAVSGALSTDPFDQQNGTTDANGVTTKAVGSVTPSEANELITACIGWAAGTSNQSIDSGFTITDNVNYSGGSHMGVALAYLIQGSASAVNPAWSWTTNDSPGTTIATFKAAAAAGAETFGFRRRLQQ